MRTKIRKICCMFLVATIMIGMTSYAAPVKTVSAKTSSVKNLKEGKSYSFNLNKKGKKEKISYHLFQGKKRGIKVKINGKVNKIIAKNEWNIDTFYDPHMQILDINKKDKYLDIWVYGYGYSEDIVFSSLYRYKNQKIEKVWDLKYKSAGESKYTQCYGKIVSTNGKGKFTVAMDRALAVDNIIGNHWDKVVFQLKNGKVSRVSKKQFYFYRTYSYTESKKRIPGLHLQKATKFYKKHRKSGGSFVLKKGTVCYPKKVYLVSKTNAYVQFKTSTGKIGWLCTEDYEDLVYPFLDVKVFD